MSVLETPLLRWPRHPATLCTALFVLPACAKAVPVYPARPRDEVVQTTNDPTPSRMTIHVTVSSRKLTTSLDQKLPDHGEGLFPLLGTDRAYRWQREPVDVEFSQGRLVLRIKLRASVDLPVSSLELPLEIKATFEPVISSEYVLVAQSVDVVVSSSDRRVKLAESAAGALTKIRDQVAAGVSAFAYDLRPILEEAHQAIAAPIPLPIGAALGCAELRILGVEAGPTVMASGIEKDISLVVAPSITMPCAAMGPAPLLPPLANVASLQSGPFVVQVPIAADYGELARAMNLAFTDGKLFFSRSYPDLYLEKPEVFASGDKLILKLRLRGPIKRFGFSMDLDGDLFLTGHPVIQDNELSIPDLEPTLDTANFLVQLKTFLDGNALRDQARKALRLDLGNRLASVRSKLSSDLSIKNDEGCLRADVHKIEITGVYPHADYLRVYVGVTAQAAAYSPCP